MSSIRLEQFEFKHRLILTNGIYRVDAMIPDEFGVGVGAEITSPFAAFAADGKAASLVALTAGATSKIGLFTRKLFMGPNQPDINLTLRFETYYSAFDEVLSPIIKLMLMTAGIKKDINELKKINQKLADGINTLQQNETTKRLTDFVTFLQAPEHVNVLVGEYMYLPNCLISNAQPRFSNIFDNAGNPMSAEIDLTLVLKEAMDQNDIAQMFNNVISSRRG